LSELSVKEWVLQRAKGVILEYMVGFKPRANIEWAVGCLTKSFAPKEGELELIIRSIENDPSIIHSSDRIARLNKLKQRLHELGVLSS